MKKNLALLMGGTSSERSISHITAQYIAKNIDQTKYNLYIIDISNNGWFYLSPDSDVRVAVDKNDFTIELNNQTIFFDVVYIAIHGAPAENGLLQGYLSMPNIPYVACNTETSAITFNKYFCKRIIQNLPEKLALDTLIDNKHGYNFKDIVSKHSLPLIVKPNSSGSSIGASKVDNYSDLNKAIEDALKEDYHVIIEDFIAGREFSVSVFSDKNEIIVLPVTEIVNGGNFFDFDSKYDSTIDNEITPAKIDNQLVNKIQDIVKSIYKTLNCDGVVRIDFIIKDNDFYFMELNSIPGQTPNSILLKQLNEAKYNLSEFYSKLIENTLSK
ncbi:MAG: D-alanine--D-alanine ligase family protein [Solitalea-like symbiont of Acarus siro]